MTYSSEVLSDSPLLYWRLGESSGTTATDASGNARHGTYAGSHTKGQTGLLVGDSDTAVLFERVGTHGSVSVADSTDLTAFSVEVWVSTATANGYLCHRESSSSGDRIFSLELSGGKARGIVWKNSSTLTNVDSTSTIHNSATRHVVLTYDGTTTRLYVDGVQTGTPSTAVSGALPTANTPFVAGAFGGVNGVSGTLDEIAYYNTALSSTRVAAHYSAGTTSGPSPQTVTPNLIASTATVYNPTLTVSGGAQTVTPAHIASTAQVFDPTLAHVSATDVIPDFIESGAVVFEPTLPDIGTPEVNRTGSWVRDNIGEALWTPAVVTSPFAQPQQVVKAQAFTAPVVTGTRTTVTPTYATEDAHRDRLVVGGKDVTYWRDVPTPTPDFQWIQPLGYGTATFTLPQAVTPFETPGVGELSWLRKGAPVLIQRVDRATNTVVATDYRGIVIAFNLSGNELTVECGGDAVGRAALLDKQMMLIQNRADAGAIVAYIIRSLRLRHQPVNGAVTGIPLIQWGGGGMLDYLNEVVAKMTTLDGDQWTVMPDADGVYETTLKDLTTIHGTVYLDDARVKGDLRSDMAEEPNRVFASGVTPEGMVVKFGAYPGLIQGEAAPYPMNDLSHFGVGTTDADTDTGDGVTIMGWMLHVTGYLDGRPGYGTYDAEVGEAIKDLKREAELSPVNSTMTPQAWRALFNLSATGYTLRKIRIEPAAATSAVRQWRLSSNGSIIARNPGFDPTVIPVDRTIAMGAGFSRAQIRQWARAELSTGAHWRGTIEITTGAIVAGDHTPGTPIASILRARDIRPGMNLRLPLFAGGITVHVAGVSINDQGRNVTLAVDTRPGDTLPVWAAIQRDRENRDTVHRSFNKQRRAASLERENTFDEVGGRITPLRLKEGWNVFPVVAKQAGTIERLRMELSPAREFVVAVFGRRITLKRLRAVTDAPLSATGSKRWTSEAVNRRLHNKHTMLYVAGSDEDPCGYSPGRKSEGDALTGRWEDDASFPFVTYVNDTDRGSVLWVAVWVGAATTLQGGRIMWPSAEDY